MLSGEFYFYIHCYPVHPVQNFYLCLTFPRVIAGDKYSKVIVCFALALGTALHSWPVVTFDYVTLDDPLYLMNNFHVNRGVTWEGLRWCRTTNYASMWHPLTWLSYMLDYQLYHGWLGGHHVTNVALHILSSVLLFLLLNRMTKALWPSAMVAALFAWHPLHVESVAWLSERKDVLCTVFWMLTLWSRLARYAEECGKNAKRRWPMMILCLDPCFLCARLDVQTDARDVAFRFLAVGLVALAATAIVFS